MILKTFNLISLFKKKSLHLCNLANQITGLYIDCNLCHKLLLTGKNELVGATIKGTNTFIPTLVIFHALIPPLILPSVVRPISINKLFN